MYGDPGQNSGRHGLAATNSVGENCRGYAGLLAFAMPNSRRSSTNLAEYDSDANGCDEMRVAVLQEKGVDVIFTGYPYLLGAKCT